MTLRELLDAETLERVRKYDKERKRRARDAGKHPCACGCGALVYQESVWARGHFDRHRKRTREEERDRLLLDMADALRAIERDTKDFRSTKEMNETEFGGIGSYFHESERKTVRALLARLDRISTQTERSHALADERAAWAGAIGTPEAGDCIGRSSAPVSSGEAPGRSACVCDPPDQVFSRTLCACGAMHTYCGKCGEQLDDCDPDPCCEDAGDCGEDCGTA